MTSPAAETLVNEPRLQEGLASLAAALPGQDEVIEQFGEIVRTAEDVDLVRINPVRFGRQHGFATAAVVDLFLRARSLGVMSMEWQYVCPGCGEIVERLTSLTSATAHYFCQVCSVDRDADLTNFIEVTFSVAPEIRRSRYHDPWSLTPEEHFFSYRFSQSAVIDDGTPLRDHLRRTALATAYVEPGATETLSLAAEPGYLWLTNGPALIVGAGRTNEVAPSRSPTPASGARAFGRRSTPARWRSSSPTRRQSATPCWPRCCPITTG